jgi:hypothetical protein
LSEGRHRSASERRVPSAVWIAIPLVVLVAAGIAFFALRGGGPSDTIPTNTVDDSIPTFDFATGKVAAVTVAKDDGSGSQAAADRTATAVTKTMTALYTEAFLDPANWRAGSYDNIWTLFDEGSRSTAQQDAETLTLGAAAGDTFDTVDQPRGRMTVRVLLDEKSQPVTAVAVVSFAAVGDRTDGKLTAIRSVGQFFLRPTSDGWRVSSFSVDRHDEVRTPKPGPTGTPSAVSS